MAPLRCLLYLWLTWSCASAGRGGRPQLPPHASPAQLGEAREREGRGHWSPAVPGEAREREGRGGRTQQPLHRSPAPLREAADPEGRGHWSPAPPREAREHEGRGGRPQQPLHRSPAPLREAREHEGRGGRTQQPLHRSPAPLREAPDPEGRGHWSPAPPREAREHEGRGGRTQQPLHRRPAPLREAPDPEGRGHRSLAVPGEAREREGRGGRTQQPPHASPAQLGEAREYEGRGELPQQPLHRSPAPLREAPDPEGRGHWILAVPGEAPDQEGRGERPRQPPHGSPAELGEAREHESPAPLREAPDPEGRGERPQKPPHGSLAELGEARDQAGHGERPQQPRHRSPAPPRQARDQVAEHMLRLYDTYSGGDAPETRAPPDSLRHPRHVPLPEGNTVRSFRARGAGTLENKELHIFNLTSLTKSESILSATLHFSIGELVNVSSSCLSPRGCSHHAHRKQIQITLSAWSLTPDGNRTHFLGHILVNVAKLHRDLLTWQSKDITQILTKAKENGEFFIGIKITFEGHSISKRMPTNSEPYILVYANDSSISESESVVSSLQGHWNFPTGALAKLNSHMRTVLSRKRRKKRSISSPLLPLQNNELPGTEYQYKEDGGWEKRKPYKALQIQPSEKSKSKKKQRKGPHQKSETLQFDEQTLKKARRKQWIEPRNCARRYLKVDFADIGWSEWIISPKSFDAYYCSGACQFPMPKSLKPSNHATIQSIVRAVGVIPGIPEPCCVPEKMSSLSILFFDENKNVVLKVYPNMTVESCACR